MDDRKLRLKGLKKASKKAKSRYFSGWKTAAIVFLVLGMVLTGICAVVLPAVGGIVLPGGKCLVEMADHNLVDNIAGAVNIDLRNLIAPYAKQVSAYLPIGTAAVWLVFFVTLIPWGAGKKKWKKSEQYLDYRTMKNTLKQEKKMK